MNFEDLEKNREEELKKRTEDEKKRRYDENKRSVRESKRCSVALQVSCGKAPQMGFSRKWNLRKH